MPISLTCPACRKKLTARDELAGKRVKCPGCRQPLLLPGARPSEHTAVGPAIQPADTGKVRGEILATYPLNPQDAWQTIARCVRSNSAYETLSTDPQTREVIFRMRTGGLIVTAAVSGEERHTDLCIAFDDHEASDAQLVKLGKALPMFRHLTPVEAGKCVAQAGAKAVLISALEARAKQVKRQGRTSPWLTNDSRFGAAILIGLGILAILANLVLLLAADRFFGVLLAVCPALFLIGFAGLIKPQVASVLLCDMGLTTPPPTGFSKTVKAVSWTLFFLGVAIGMLIVFAAITS